MTPLTMKIRARMSPRLPCASSSKPPSSLPTWLPRRTHRTKSRNRKSPSPPATPPRSRVASRLHPRHRRGLFPVFPMRHTGRDCRRAPSPLRRNDTCRERPLSHTCYGTYARWRHSGQDLEQLCLLRSVQAERRELRCQKSDPILYDTTGAQFGSNADGGKGDREDAAKRSGDSEGRGEWQKTSAKEVEQVDQMNAGRMSGFGTYSSYGGAGGYNTSGVHSGATGGWNSQMGFGLYSDDQLRSTPASGGGQASSSSGWDRSRSSNDVKRRWALCLLAWQLFFCY